MAETPRQPTRSGTPPWPDEFAARYTAAGYWDGRSLGEHLYAAADLRPDTVCLVDGDVRLTFAQLMARADGAALRLRALGLRADDRVILQLANCWEFVAMTVACLRLGVVPVMALPANRRQEIAAVAAHVQAVALIVPTSTRDFDLQAMAAEIAAEQDGIAHVLVLGDKVLPGHVDVTALLAPAEDPAAARARLDATPPAGQDVALFLMTGGTTGMPKLVARTHDDFGFMARRAAEICQVGPGSVYLAALPLGHGFPMSGPGVLGTLMAGGRAVIAATPAPERAFPLIARERVTLTSLVPAIIQRWLEYRESDPDTDLSSLLAIQSGGARLPEHVTRGVEPVLGCRLQQVYGMSEGLLCLTRPDDPDEVVWHTQGRPICVDDELVLVDEDGEPAPAGAPGVLLTRGPYTPRGYYRAEGLNAHSHAGGWYRTGDIVRIRPDGNVVVEGRDKDVINRGGEKIPAEEIENVAHQLPGVRMAAAVAMPDAELGERICLYAVAHTGHQVTLDDVRNAMETVGLARFKLPERLVLVGELPVTNVGKIDKKALRSDIAQRIAAEAA
ncbi:AMP-binding protein [Catellatospora sp. KI3]|uniref:(2,3-dihydroxybenzoyl)adenylate synthase n=1 Tax=Catellatospora sp. KI3 TaxID=3041620 RepID=UPI0024831918|nr:AMP-binding protein [Catellatospora sp. KI3]MDI1461435.1 AMP-binding protein [Catellatospora sp. KI3]